MKQTLLPLLTIVALAPAATVSASLPQEAGVSSELTYASRYVFRGVQFAGNSFQPTLEASLGDLYAGIWANLPTAQGQGSEINYYGGFALPIPAVDFATLDLGMTVYHYPKAGAERTHEFYAGVDVPTIGIPEISGSLYYFYDVDIRSHVAEGALTYSFSLEGWGLPAALDFSVLGGLVGGSRIETEDFSYYGASIELPFHLNDYSAITPGVHYATAEKYTFAPGERGRNLFWNISYSAAF